MFTSPMITGLYQDPLTCHHLRSIHAFDLFSLCIDLHGTVWNGQVFTTGKWQIISVNDSSCVLR